MCQGDPHQPTSRRHLLRSGALLAAAVVGCQSNPRQPDAQSKTARNANKATAQTPVAPISNTDACATRLHEVCGPLLLYYATRHQLPERPENPPKIPGFKPSASRSAPAPIPHPDPCPTPPPGICRPPPPHSPPRHPPPERPEELAQMPGFESVGELVCPVSKRPYLYNPIGVMTKGEPARIIMYDPAPSHSRMRRAIAVIEPQRQIDPLTTQLTALPQSPSTLPPSPPPARLTIPLRPLCVSAVSLPLPLRRMPDRIQQIIQPDRLP